MIEECWLALSSLAETSERWVVILGLSVDPDQQASLSTYVQ